MVTAIVQFNTTALEIEWSIIETGNQMLILITENISRCNRENYRKIFTMQTYGYNNDKIICLQIHNSMLIGPFISW